MACQEGEAVGLAEGVKRLEVGIAPWESVAAATERGEELVGDVETVGAQTRVAAAAGFVSALQPAMEEALTEGSVGVG